jgi:hypothetical protein
MYCYFLQNIDHNIGFWERRQLFRLKLVKIAEIVITTPIPDEFGEKAPKIWPNQFWGQNYYGKKNQKIWASSVSFKKSAQSKQSPKSRKIAQSGHTVSGIALKSSVLDVKGPRVKNPDDTDFA